MVSLRIVLVICVSFVILLKTESEFLPHHLSFLKGPSSIASAPSLPPEIDLKDPFQVDQYLEELLDSPKQIQTLKDSLASPWIQEEPIFLEKVLNHLAMLRSIDPLFLELLGIAERTPLESKPVKAAAIRALGSIESDDRQRMAFVRKKTQPFLEEVRTEIRRKRREKKENFNDLWSTVCVARVRLGLADSEETTLARQYLLGLLSGERNRESPLHIAALGDFPKEDPQTAEIVKLLLLIAEGSNLDDRPYVRGRALISLGRLGAGESLILLLRWLENPAVVMKMAAMETLAELQKSNPKMIMDDLERVKTAVTKAILAKPEEVIQYRGLRDWLRSLPDDVLFSILDHFASSSEDPIVRDLTSKEAYRRRFRQVSLNTRRSLPWARRTVANMVSRKDSSEAFKILSDEIASLGLNPNEEPFLLEAILEALSSELYQEYPLGEEWRVVLEIARETTFPWVQLQAINVLGKSTPNKAIRVFLEEVKPVSIPGESGRFIKYFQDAVHQAQVRLGYRQAILGDPLTASL